MLLVESKQQEAEQRRIARGIRENDKELALDNQKTEYERRLSELQNQIGKLNQDRDEEKRAYEETVRTKEGQLNVANQEIADLRAENRRMKKDSNILHFESFEKVWALVLGRMTVKVQDWNHIPVPNESVKVNYSGIDKLKMGHRSYSRDYYIGYVQKKLSINFGVDLSKVRLSRSDGTIMVYGVKSKPFGMDECENEDEVFLRYTAFFNRTDLTPDCDISQTPENLNVTASTAEETIEAYKIHSQRRFYDAIDGVRCRFDRAEDMIGSICFGDKALREWEEVRKEDLRKRMFGAIGDDFKFEHENTVKLFHELLSILLKPLGCEIVIDKSDTIPDGAMSLRKLCEEYNAEQMKLLENNFVE